MTEKFNKYFHKTDDDQRINILIQLNDHRSRIFQFSTPTLNVFKKNT